MTALAASSPASSLRANLSTVNSTRASRAVATAPKLRYIVVILAGIFAILGGQLLLSIAVSGAAYEISGLKAQVRGSHQQLQIVAEEISALTAPDTLAGLATSMGMVEDNNPAYLRLSDATVIGEAVAAASSDSTTVFTVTAGTEVHTPPPIVNAVYDSVTQAAALEVLAQDDLVALTAEATAVAEASSSVVVSPAMVTTEPAVRFGGTIPSPTTR